MTKDISLTYLKWQPAFLFSTFLSFLFLGALGLFAMFTQSSPNRWLWTMGVVGGGFSALATGIFWGLYLRNRPIYLGKRGQLIEEEQRGTKDFQISQEKALELAEPHLAKSLELRSQMGLRTGKGAYAQQPGEDHISLWGEWYLVTRDNYPYKTVSGHVYFRHAVRVHVDTGKVIAPG